MEESTSPEAEGRATARATLTFPVVGAIDMYVSVPETSTDATFPLLASIKFTNSSRIVVLESNVLLINEWTYL